MREELSKPELKETYRKQSKAFTRDRKLGFVTCAVLILQKSVKSLQVKLNEYFGHSGEETVTAGAYTQARAKLDPMLFYDLNKKSYAQGWYVDEDYKRYKGHRLLAIDGSTIRLPENKSIDDEFGAIRIKNQVVTGRYAGGRASVMYDVLNEIIIDSALVSSKTGEVKLAIQHLEHCQDNDLILFDRGYSGYELFAMISSKKANFVCRCSSNKFGAIDNFIFNESQKDEVVTLIPHPYLRSKLSKQNLPESVKIRLVKLTLPTGEKEILATTLLNKSKYKLKDFSKLYFMRWGVETFFDRLKNRLALENFSGKTACAVKQDFYATILITNVESEITGDVDDQLMEKTGNKYKSKVRKTVSYSAIKHQIIDLLFCHDIEYDALVGQLRQLFQKNTIPIRPNRSENRYTSCRHVLQFYQRTKKFLF